MNKRYLHTGLFLIAMGSGIAGFAQPSSSAVTAEQFDELQAQLSPQALDIFEKAEALYPELFSDASEFRTTEGFIYKYYAAQQTYIGIRDNMVYLLGGPFGSTITNYGTVTNTLAYLVDVENVALSQTLDPILANAWEKRISDLQVRGTGVVSRLLADDINGDRHQRFIVRLRSGQTLLIAHNIDLAPRVPSIRVGDEVAFYGEYEWSAEGGVIHWTHHDPNGKHVPGWIAYQGVTYQ